jgi:hypothetical protein
MLQLDYNKDTTQNSLHKIITQKFVLRMNILPPPNG